MKGYQTIIIALLALALIFFGGFAAGYFYSGKSHPAAPAGTAKVDTLKIKVPYPVIQIKRIPGKIRHDTLRVYSDLNDSTTSNGYACIKVASMDTTVAGSGRASVDYFFPPVNKFDFLFQPAPKRDSLIFQTVYRDRAIYKQHWYQKDWLWFAAGSAATVFIARQANR